MSENISDYGSEYLVDTDVIINHLKRKSSSLYNLHGEARLYISVLTEYELFVGINNQIEENELENLMHFFTRLEITSDICRKAAEFERYHGIAHILGPIDLLIAATAVQKKMKLITENKKHFRLVPEVKLYSEA